MRSREILSYCMDSLGNKGAAKYECVLTETKKYEMNVETMEMSLFRTTFDTKLQLTAIKANKKGSITINKTDTESIDQAVEKVFELMETSNEDPAYDIAPKQEPREFSSGGSDPDFDKMYSRLSSFLGSVKKDYPQILLIQAILDFQHSVKHFVNSNGVDYTSRKGVYNFSTWFSSKEGQKTSSFNGTGISVRELDKELLDCGSLRSVLEQSVQHLDARPFAGKFVGDIIITPECLNDFLSMYAGVFLRDNSLIAGTSRLKDKLNETVASPKLTVHSKPASQEISNGYFVTPDGFAAENVTIIDKGVLKSFLLSLYGANKTGKERSKTAGGAYVVDPGEKSFDEIIKGVDKGLLVARYSGGNPNSNGDFSGVAKNSFYIENGEIKYPVTETMIAGNLLEVFQNIKDISRERIDFGTAILPWICSTGVTISGK